MVPAGPAGISWNRRAAAPCFPAAFAYAGGRVPVSPPLGESPRARGPCRTYLQRALKHLHSECEHRLARGGGAGGGGGPRVTSGLTVRSQQFRAAAEVGTGGRRRLGAGVPWGPWGRVLAHRAHRLHSDTCLVWLSLSGRARCSPGQANRATTKRYGRECPQGPKGGAQRPDSSPACPPRPPPRPALPRVL